jgi:sugar/nucleoside kinase (ribokinase family)
MEKVGTIWVVGAVAMDTVVYFQTLIQHGRYVQAEEVIRRVGGSPANVALGLAASGVKTSFVTALGADPDGEIIRERLTSAGFESVSITQTSMASNQCIVMIEPTGERTMFGLGPGNISHIKLVGIDLSPEDTVVFVGWNSLFYEDLEYAKGKGCITFVGLGAILDSSVTADVAFGSLSDLPPGYDFLPPLERFEKVVVTRGELGATQYSDSGELNQPAIESEVLDTTGAGDAFLAGYLLEHSLGDREGKSGMMTGAKWASAMVGLKDSVPPNFNDVVPQNYRQEIKPNFK